MLQSTSFTSVETNRGDTKPQASPGVIIITVWRMVTVNIRKHATTEGGEACPGKEAYGDL
jgi:hypothetical protein